MILTLLRRLFRHYWLVLVLLFFCLSRLYIFTHPPAYVRYFEEYANIWHYGWPPYLKHWYEYPPATIPFVSAPLWLDLAGIGQYRWNFRTMNLAVDTFLFILILLSLSRLRLSWSAKLLSLSFYLLATTKAKDFMYDNLDLLFSLCFFAPAVWPLFSRRTRAVGQWLWFWLGTGLKLINLPLGFAYWWQSQYRWWQRLLLVGVTFLALWAVPLFLYRSSLSVVLVYHQQRQLQVESFPALMVRGLNHWTKSEEIFFSEAKSFDLRGPLSQVALPLSQGALVLFGLGLTYYCWVNRDRGQDPVYLIKVNLIFIFGYFLTNKVFSTPYHLWYLPLLTVYPYRSMRQRVLVLGAAMAYVGAATTAWPAWEVWPGFFLDSSLPIVTQVPLTLFLAWQVIRLPISHQATTLNLAAPAPVTAFGAAVKAITDTEVARRSTKRYNS